MLKDEVTEISVAIFFGTNEYVIKKMMVASTQLLHGAQSGW